MFADSGPQVLKTQYSGGCHVLQPGQQGLHFLVLPEASDGRGIPLVPTSAQGSDTPKTRLRTSVSVSVLLMLALSSSVAYSARESDSLPRRLYT